MQKIAAIDTGSNAIRLIVANLDDNWRVEPIESIRMPVRLGQDVFTNGFLEESTIRQTVEAFLQFRRIIDDFGVSKLRAVATCALREAKNREVLIDRIAHNAGIELEVISGEEEARLVHLAISSASDLSGKRALLVDIGGGSVEISVTRNGNILSSNSYNLGTVRLLQKLPAKSASLPPQTLAQLLCDSVEASRRRIEAEIGAEKVDVCIGTGGNVEEIGKLRQKLFKQDDDRSITSDELDRLVEHLSRMNVRTRIRKLKLRPDRADVILPAAIVLRLIAEIAHSEEILIPNVGLKNGLLLDLAKNMAEEMHLPNRDQVWESAVRIGQKYHCDLEHGSLVAKLAGCLFDQAGQLHFLDGEERLILEIGALLHDVGHFIGTVDHDQHGYYLLKANHLIGLSDRQQEMVASLVRYHRKGSPYQDEAASRLLSARDRLIVTKLCAFLRLADALDSSHLQRVDTARFIQRKSAWLLHVDGRDDLTLEKWTALKRGSLFQEIFGVALELEE